MNAETLITDHLDLWTEAITKKSNSGRGSNRKVELTGVKNLRELILELAVSGRLVKSESNAEPAQRLLAKIEAEKARLIAQGLIKKPKKLAEASDSHPYSLPPHWCWVQLGSVTNYGTTDKAEPNQVADNTWVLELEDIEKESSKLLSKVRYMDRQFKSSKNRFERNDVLYGKLRPYLDKVLVADEPGVCTTEIIPIRSYLGLLPEFLRLALKSPSFKLYANDSTHGMNLPRLGTDKARLAMIPLAPEQEQHRIVQKVDELMALCDRLEQQTSDQIAAHDTLVDTLLGTLTQSQNATELAENWTRLAAHFDTLFTTEKSIDKLKQTILQLAVMGKLIEQGKLSESGIDHLQKISKAKEEQLTQTKGRKSKPLPPIEESEIPFALPQGWSIARLDDITDIQSGIAKGKKNTGKKTCLVPYLRVANVQRAALNLSEIKEIEIVEDDVERYLIVSRDLLITEGGDWDKVGRTAIWEGAISPIIHQNHVFRARLYLPDQSEAWIEKYLNSQFARSYFADSSKQTTNLASINKTQLRSCTIPMPPPQEQDAIIKKANLLFSLCDDLAGKVRKAGETQLHLAETLSSQAISG